MGKTIMSGTVGHKIDSTFNNNDWDTIALACQKNIVPSTWSIGDQKIMTINNKEYLIDIIGKNKDSYFDGSGTAPLTFGLHSVFGVKYPMSVSDDNTYVTSTMHTITLQLVLNLFPDNIRNNIKLINKTDSTNGDYLFIFNNTDLSGGYEYFNSDAARAKTYPIEVISVASGTPSIGSGYWTATPTGSSSRDQRYCYVQSSGKISTLGNFPTSLINISFGFCF